MLYIEFFNATIGLKVQNIFFQKQYAIYNIHFNAKKNLIKSAIYFLKKTVYCMHNLITSFIIRLKVQNIFL